MFHRRHPNGCLWYNSRSSTGVHTAGPPMNPPNTHHTHAPLSPPTRHLPTIHPPIHLPPAPHIHPPIHPPPVPYIHPHKHPPPAHRMHLLHPRCKLHIQKCIRGILPLLRLLFTFLKTLALFGSHIHVYM